MTDTATLVRLNKALADAGLCSRRAADTLIFAGKVRVDGQTIREPGLRVDPSRQRIEVEGRPLPAPAAPGHTYLLLHKPVEVVTTLRDPEGRTTVLDLLPPELRSVRLVPVGRLDYFSEGLLLLTDDGELTHRLTHARWHLDKEYHVLVRGEVPASALETMRQGMTLAEGETLAPVTATLLRRLPGKTLLRMVLVQGINRQIRRMCRDLGLTVLRLTRVRQGPIHLGELGKGQVRALRPEEVGELRQAVGLA